MINLIQINISRLQITSRVFKNYTTIQFFIFVIFNKRLEFNKVPSGIKTFLYVISFC